MKYNSFVTIAPFAVIPPSHNCAQAGLGFTPPYALVPVRCLVRANSPLTHASQLATAKPRPEASRTATAEHTVGHAARHTAEHMAGHTAVAPRGSSAGLLLARALGSASGSASSSARGPAAAPAASTASADCAADGSVLRCRYVGTLRVDDAVRAFMDCDADAIAGYAASLSVSEGWAVGSRSLGNDSCFSLKSLSRLSITLL